MSNAVRVAYGRALDDLQPTSTRDRAAHDWRISRYAQRFSALRPSLLIYPRLPLSLFAGVEVPRDSKNGCTFPGCGNKRRGSAFLCSSHLKQIHRRGWMTTLAPAGARGPGSRGPMPLATCPRHKIKKTRRRDGSPECHLCDRDRARRKYEAKRRARAVTPCN